MLSNTDRLWRRGGNSGGSIDMAPGVVGAADQRAGFDVAEAHLICCGLEVLKLFRRYVAFDFKLPNGRLQVLADRNDVDVVRTQVVQSRHDLIVLFSDSDHEA